MDNIDRTNYRILLSITLLLSLFSLKVTTARTPEITISEQEQKLADSLLKNLKAKSWEDTLILFNKFAAKNQLKNYGSIIAAGKKLRIMPDRPCLNPNLSEAWLHMSKAFYATGYFSEAERYVDRVIHCPVDVSTPFLLDAITHKALIETVSKKTQYALQLAEIVIKSNDASATLKTKAYLAKSMALYDIQKYPEAEEASEEAVKLLQKDSTDFNTYVSVNVQAGLVDYILGKLPDALNYYLNARRVAEKHNAQDLLFTIYNNIGTVLWQTGDTKAAASFFEKALVCYQQMKYQESADVEMIYNNLGLIYDELGNSMEAENFLARSIQGYRQSGDTSGMIYPLNNLANLCLRQKRIEEGLKYINLAIQILENQKRYSELIPVLHTKAQLLVEKKVYAEAETLVDRAISIAKNLSLHQELVYLYEEKARIAELTGDYKKALEYFKVHKDYEKKYNEYLTEVKVVQARSETADRIYEEDQPVKEEPTRVSKYGVSRAWAYVTMLTGLLIVSLIFLFNQYLLTHRTRIEKQKMEEEITRLRKSLAEHMVKAAESDQLKNHILTTMYHELRTPLNGINGFAEMLIEECAEEKHRHMARAILQSGERLLNTLNGILDLSDTELLKLDIRLSNFNVHQVIEKLVREKYRDRAEEKGLEFYYQPRSTQLMIRTDEEMFIRILDLLVDNAVKFTTKGSITIEIAQEERNNKTFAHIKIKDTGIGIPHELQGLIFASFRQASEGHQRSHDGVGIGLSLAKNLVNILGGKIHVESQPGEGSTFTIIFPSLTTEELQKDSQFKAYVDPGPKAHKVLVVEDDDTNREFMVYNLQSLYQTDVAIDGIEALEKAKTFHYDAILLDISLGRGLSGIDVVKELRKNPETRLLPVAAITANVRLYKPEEMIEAGFSHYLAKPFTRSELLALVSTMIGHPREI